MKSISLRLLLQYGERGFYSNFSHLICNKLNNIFIVSLTNVFTSSSLLIQAEEQASSPSMNSQVGGFAAMAGIDIGNAGAQDKATLAIAMLESRDFLKHILTFESIAESLMAAERYNDKLKH